jgi:thymidylate kinase
VLHTVAALFERLEAEDIRYCHWKSNWVLEETVEGKTDLDLLVERQAAPAFRKLLQELAFRPAVDHGSPLFPSVEHYHALDESGELVHVHAYYRVISGDSLVKNYRFPVEEMLLGHTRKIGVVAVPSKGAELVVFVLRMCLKHTSAVELALLLRSFENVGREAAWLATDEARAEASALLPVWLPGFAPTLFEDALQALTDPAPLARRMLVARRVRAELRPYARHGRAKAWSAGVRTFARHGLARLGGTRIKLAPATGGAVIAFVGVEASGKSTMLGGVQRWLGSHYTVRRIHAGKPPSTALTFVPNLLLPALRALVPDQRSTIVSARLTTEARPQRGRFPLLFGVRSVLLAHDRRALLTRAFASSANGTIVLCDRYPSSDDAPVDGAQLGVAATGVQDPIRKWLAEREARLYRDVPPADLVLQLTAPLDVTLERNRKRAKVEPEEYVLSRHARSSSLEFDRVRVVKVDTNRPVDESARDIRRIIWEAL